MPVNIQINIPTRYNRVKDEVISNDVNFANYDKTVQGGDVDQVEFEV